MSCDHQFKAKSVRSWLEPWVFLVQRFESAYGRAYWWYEEKDLGLGGEFSSLLEEEASPEFPITPNSLALRKILVKGSLNGVLGESTTDSCWGQND